METYRKLTVIYYTDVIIDVIFAVDILIMFRTNYRDDKRDIVISDGKMIAINYVKGRFLIDLIASIPFDFIIDINDDSKARRTGNIFQVIKLTRLLRLGRMVSYIKFIAKDLKFGMKIAQTLLFIIIFLNLCGCIYIKMFSLTIDGFDLDLVDVSDYYQESAPDQSGAINKLVELFGYPTMLPAKLKTSPEEYYQGGDLLRYNVMLFMTLFNILGNDIAPETDSTFWVSSILMLIGFLIVSNLIGEFSNVLNDIYESDLNNEIEENRNQVE